MIFSYPQFSIVLGLATIVYITLTQVTPDSSSNLAVTIDLQNILELAEKLHDEIIEFHIYSHILTFDVIDNPQHYTSDDLRSIHDALCQIYTSICNISDRFDIPLYILNTLQDQGVLSHQDLELIERFEDIRHSFITLSKNLTKIIEDIELNSTTGHRFFTR